MDSVAQTVARVLSAAVAPVRCLGRSVGHLVALALVLAVPVVVSACAFAWLLVFHSVRLTVGLTFGDPLGVVTAVGLPGAVNGVPLLYLQIPGVPTALLLGWPAVDRDASFSPPTLPYG
ncbi:MAG: hypothetical protein ABEJ61_10815 [Haloferacaceae archaeon]